MQSTNPMQCSRNVRQKRPSFGAPKLQNQGPGNRVSKPAYIDTFGLDWPDRSTGRKIDSKDHALHAKENCNPQVAAPTTKSGVVRTKAARSQLEEPAEACHLAMPLPSPDSCVQEKAVYEAHLQERTREIFRLQKALSEQENLRAMVEEQLKVRSLEVEAKASESEALKHRVHELEANAQEVIDGRSPLKQRRRGVASETPEGAEKISDAGSPGEAFQESAVLTASLTSPSLMDQATLEDLRRLTEQKDRLEEVSAQKDSQFEGLLAEMAEKDRAIQKVEDIRGKQEEDFRLQISTLEEEAQRNFDAKSAELESANQQVDEFRLRNFDLVKEVEELRRNEVQFQEELCELEKKMLDLRDQKATEIEEICQTVSLQYQAKIDDLSNKLSEEETRMDQQAPILRKQKFEIEEQAAEIGHRIAENERLEAEVELLRESSERLQQQLDAERIENEEQHKEASDKISEQEKLLEKNGLDLEQHVAELLHVRQMLEESRRLEMEQETKADDLEKEVKKLQSQKLRLEEEQEFALQSAGEEAKQLATQKHRCAELESAIEEANKKAAEGNDERQRIHSEVQELKQEKATLESTVQGLKEEKATSESIATKEAADQEVALQKLQSELQALKEERVILESAASKGAADHEDALQNLLSQVSMLRDEKAALESAELKNASEHEAAQQALKSEVSTLRDEKATLESAVLKNASEHEAIQQALKSEVSTLRDEKAALESAALKNASEDETAQQALKTEVSILRDEKAALESEALKNASEHEAAQEALKSEVSALKDEKAALESAALKKASEHEAVQQALKSEVSTLKDEKANLRSVVSKSASEHEAMQKALKSEVADMSSKLSQQDQEIKTRREELETWQTEAARVRVESNANTSTLEEEVRRLEEVVSAQTAEMQGKGQLAEVLSDKVASLEAEITSKNEVEDQLRNAEHSLVAVKAQLAATKHGLDEEKAERIRQGAHAEALEAQLKREQSGRTEEVSAAKTALALSRWSILTDGINKHQKCVEGLKFDAAIAVERKAELREKVAAQKMARIASSVTQATRCNAWSTLVKAFAKSAKMQAITQENRIVELSAEVERLMEQTQRTAFDEDKLVRQSQVLQTCEKEVEDLRVRNRELSVTLQQFKQENEHLVIENKGLVENVAHFEGDLEKVSDRHAQLIGHVNKKQKIRYTMKLKEECLELRSELGKMRIKQMQLEGRSRAENLHGALAALGYHAPDDAVICRGSPSKHPGCSPQASPRISKCGVTINVTSTNTPGQRNSAVNPRRLIGALTVAGSSSTAHPSHAAKGHSLKVAAAEAEKEDALRRCRFQERALERVNSDFEHLVSLVERAVVGEASVSDGQPKPDGTANFADLLKKLRVLIKSQSSNTESSSGGTTCSNGNGPSARTEPPSTPDRRKTSPERAEEIASPLDLSKSASPFDLKKQLE
eukprot:TRINITY_DN18889_c0_g1_i1.p1 TRINITY_DN18889_c0_g1~~TRINITY_DN18889_c0_g1_i1.p1  ORF type:complete len:1436 (+),score=430.97 TRINITY_DN18889_c0_g1_i1:102-4409(+)